MIIEFVGLPASGKSTIANHLIKRLRNFGFRVNHPTYDLKNQVSRTYRICRKMNYGISALVQSPILSAQQLKLIFDSNQQSRSDTVRNIYNWLYLAGLGRQYQSQTDVTVIDQGLIQALWSIDLSSRNQSVTRLKQLAVSELKFVEDRIVVIVRCDRSAIKQRLANRKRNASRVSPNTNSTYSLDEALKSMDKTIDVLSECSSEFKNVIEVKSNEQKDIADAVSVIIEKLRINLPNHEKHKHD